MFDENERIIREYKLWYPSFYDRTVDISITGYHMLLAVLDNGNKVEFSLLDNGLRDVTHIYNVETDDDMCEEEWRKRFGDRLKTLIRDRSFNHETMSELLGISRVMLSRYINGKATPSSYAINRIARVLNCDVRDLVDFNYILRD